MKLLTCITACLLSATTYAQYSLQRYDVNQPTINSGSMPMAFTGLGDNLYFSANTSATGREIFRIKNNVVENITDQAISPGPTPSMYQSFSYMPTLNGTVYFVGMGTQNWQLYSIEDATGDLRAVPLTGTSLVEISGINNVIDIGDKLYFVGADITGSDEIYSYDPVSRVVEQISQLQTLTADPVITQLTNYNGILAFTFESPQTGREFGIVDPVRKMHATYDIYPGTVSSSPGQFAVYNDKLYMRARTTGTGYELFSFDPMAGVTQLTDIAPSVTYSLGSLGSSNALIPYKEGIIFMATADGTTYDLYRHDIASQATSIIANLGVRHTQLLLTASAEYGGKLFLAIDSNTYYTRMYVYDGVNPLYRAGQLVGGSDITRVTNMRVCGGRLVFDAAVLPFLDVEVNVITDSAVLGIPETRIGANAVVYPNPASTEATISFTLKQPATLNILLTDMQGRTVYTTNKQYNTGKQEAVMPVSTLAAGVYTYTVMNEEGTVLGKGKLVKE